MTKFGKNLPAGPANKTVVAVVYDRLCTFEFGITTELFALPRPELAVDWYKFAVASADDRPLRTLGGVVISAPGDLTAIASAGTVVLPGWRDPDERPSDALVDALKAAHSSGGRIVSICSGAFVLAATGLVDGMAVATHWRYADRLETMYPRVHVRSDVLYVDNGTTLTSAGSAAGLDLGIHLIGRDYGAAVAESVARRLVLPPHRAGSQAQRLPTISVGRERSAVAATVDWAMTELHRPLTVAELASHAGMSARTFARRFKSDMGVSPHRWITWQRVSVAQRLLQTTQLSVEDIASASGFGSAAALRHHFRQQAQTTPVRYRRAYALPQRKAVG